jgi:hypothetical protein
MSSFEKLKVEQRDKSISVKQLRDTDASEDLKPTSTFRPLDDPDEVGEHSVSGQASGRSASSDETKRLDNSVDPRVEGTLIGSGAEALGLIQQEVLAQLRMTDDFSEGNISLHVRVVSGKADPRVEGFVIGAAR